MATSIWEKAISILARNLNSGRIHLITAVTKRFFSIAGMLYNLTESYDCAFYLAASLFLIAGAVMSLPVLKFHKPNKNGSNYATTSDIEVYSRSTSSIETQTFVEDLVED